MARGRLSFLKALLRMKLIVVSVKFISYNGDDVVVHPMYSVR